MVRAFGVGGPSVDTVLSNPNTRPGLALGDLDEVAVHPLPAQERILEAFAWLGFRFARADIEHGGLYGVRQTLPLYQEIEFYPPAIGERHQRSRGHVGGRLEDDGGGDFEE